MQLGRFADRTDRPHRMVHVLGDIGLGRILVGRDIDRDAIVGPVDFAAEERLVVRRIVPGGGAGHHVLIELLGVFERFGGLGRVEDHLVAGIDGVAAMRPEAPMHPSIAIPRGMSQSEAARRVVLLHRLGVFEELVGRGREFREARLVRRLDAVIHHVAAVADRNTDPLATALAVLLGGGHPAAIFLAEIVGDIADVHALLREEMRQRIEAPEDVLAGAGIGRDGRLGLHVFVGFARDGDLHARRLGEGVDQGDEGVVLGLHEILPAQHRQFRAAFRLPRSRLSPGLRPFDEAGAGQCPGRSKRGAARQKSAACNQSHSCFLP